MDTTAAFKRDVNRVFTYIEAESELRFAYDKSLGIDVGRHGSAVSEFENSTIDSLYEHWLGVYLYERIKEHLGVSFDDWLKQPRYRMEIQLRQVRKRNKAEEDLANQVAEQAATQPQK